MNSLHFDWPRLAAQAGLALDLLVVLVIAVWAVM